MGVNQRLSKIVCDSMFTNRLTLLRYLWNGFIFPLSRIVLDRFCLQILPEIHHKIQWLNLESLSMERILFAADYPNLRGLGLYNINQKTAVHFFMGEQILTRTFKNQISTVIITISNKKEDLSAKIEIMTVCSHIFTAFPNLLYLNFHQSSDRQIDRLSFDCQIPMFCSTLLELHIKVQRFDDILYLLDGRFNKLCIFYVDVINIACTHTSLPMINNNERLSNMKCFSMTSSCETCFYDELIVPLLQRIHIFNHMSRLNIFTFNIRSKISFYDQMNLLSNEDIKNTLTNLGDDYKINCCVDYFSKEKTGQCHIYSYPYSLTYYDNITNNFSGGLFKYVHNVSLFDERPFEHEFFIRITQAFPFLKQLTINNLTPQNHKQYENLNNNQDLPIIKYPYLTDLDFIDVHDDYIEQFLVNTKTYLSNYIHTIIDYNSLQRVTHNFTREATRINCYKFSRLIFCDVLDFPKHIVDYFPHAEIIIF
ncbi:unnamed protein product [Rotaria sordida]|uniref:Uncharacterized protein n=1 Tax=Rotaria sordida TaxID=392033 RepID=A0A814MQ10_9BILA|nr:unnamed protein product [Rotaria sordida]CAF1362184.1 unnamed protein product [Rotaria sordida]